MKKHFYDLAPLQEELFQVLKKYDIPLVYIDDAFFYTREILKDYFNKLHNDTFNKKLP